LLGPPIISQELFYKNTIELLDLEETA
jgi:hypothetical protein